MPVDPIKPKLEPPGTKRLKLNRDVLLSTSAFKYSLRRYTEGVTVVPFTLKTTGGDCRNLVKQQLSQLFKDMGIAPDFRWEKAGPATRQMLPAKS